MKHTHTELINDNEKYDRRSINERIGETHILILANTKMSPDEVLFELLSDDY